MENEHLENPTEEMAEQGKNIGNSVKQKVGKLVKEKAKQIGRKILAKAGKLAVKLLAKAVVALAPYILIILAVLFVAIAGFYIMYEIRGSEQIYIYDASAQNETIRDDEKGYDRVDPNNINGKTEAIENFYRYMSAHSYWQILGDDNEKLEQDTGIYDYYNKEKEYYLNKNLLFSLDETMYRKKFIYPEQFIKPIKYNPDDLTLESLTNDKGEIIVESTVYDKDGKPTNTKEKSVSDYGIASIFKYKEDEKKLTVEGVMYKKEVWDVSLNDKVSVDTNEPFEYTMEGYPQTIHLMTKAITFAGEFEFEYEKLKTQQSELSDNHSADTDPSKAVKKILLGYGKKYRWENYNDIEIDEFGNKKVVVKTRRVFDSYVPLYGYRKGGIYETVPVLKKTTPTDKGQKYLRDYLYNFKAYIPESVMTEFNFEERVGSDYGMEVINMATGSGRDSDKLKRSLQYFGIAQKYGEHFGVDPYLIIAIITQESGGIPDINHKGLMQITGTSTRQITAKNANGVKESFSITPEGRKDPDDAIRWGTMYLKYLLDMFEGDPVKATLAYNMGEGTVGWIRDNYSSDWDSDKWVTHIQQANQEKLNGNGDNAYLEHVFQYYIGTNTKKEDTGIVDAIANSIKKVFSALKKDYSSETKYNEFTHFTSVQEVDWALRLAGAMEKVQLFSETETATDLLFWESGYSDQIANVGNPFLEWNPDLVKDYTPPLNIKHPVVTSRYGPRWNKTHAGTDIAVPVGTPLYASADGIIVKAVKDQTYSKKSWGNYVKIGHKDNNYTLYAHMNSVIVNEGDTVKQGQLIGYSGNSGNSTGPHLHFEFYLGGAEGSRRVDSYPIAVQPDLFP